MSLSVALVPQTAQKSPGGPWHLRPGAPHAPQRRQGNGGVQVRETGSRKALRRVQVARPTIPFGA